MLNQIEAGALSVAYEEHGPPAGMLVVLLHGFPYGVRAYDEVTPPLVATGCRVITPYLRGYGPTRLLSAATPQCVSQRAGACMQSDPRYFAAMRQAMRRTSRSSAMTRCATPSAMNSARRRRASRS